MVFKWSENHMPLFLKHFKNHPCLWDFKLEGYKDKFSRTKAMASLVKDLNIEGVNERDIRLKIKSIRTRYATEIKKIKKSHKNSDGEVYVPKLYWFKQADEFLNGVCSPRISSDPIRPPSRSNSEASQNIELPSRDANEADLETRLSPSPELDAQSVYEQPQQNCRRRPKRLLSRIKPFYSKPNADEFHYFGLSVASQLRAMPFENAMDMQSRIQMMLSTERRSLNRDLTSRDNSEGYTNHSSNDPLTPLEVTFKCENV